MGRGSSKAGGGGGGGNAKYHGFSITNAEGQKKNYIVAAGQVLYAESNRRGYGIGNIDELETMQRAYDTYGSVSKLINKVNSIDIAKAEVLSDKKVKEMQDKYTAESKKKRKQFESDVYKGKKRVNRHSAYWSAM